MSKEKLIQIHQPFISPREIQQKRQQILNKRLHCWERLNFDLTTFIGGSTKIEEIEESRAEVKRRKIEADLEEDIKIRGREKWEEEDVS